MKWLHAAVEESDSLVLFSFVTMVTIGIVGLTLAEIGLLWQAIRWAWGF